MNALDATAERSAAQRLFGALPAGLFGVFHKASRVEYARVVLDLWRTFYADPRTFSLEIAGRTKALEERRGAVVAAPRAVFSFEGGMSADDVLGTFGLARFRQPLLLRAGAPPRERNGFPRAALSRPPEDLAASIVPTRRAPYLLIVENLTTFRLIVACVR